MFLKRLIRSSATILVIFIVFVEPLTAADPVRLRYISRYIRETDVGRDHLMGVELIQGHFGIVSSYEGLILLNLEALPVEGNSESVARLPGLDAYSTVSSQDGYIYVNERLGGFAVVKLDVNHMSLTLLNQVSEEGVFFEKMCLAQDRLYVAAHAFGLRIYDLTDPANPIPVGSLESGFDDAWAVAVDGDTAYVADGAGGLKVVDISNESSPVIIAGEDPGTAAGTAEDVLLVNGRIYVACGSPGVAVYTPGDLAVRVLYSTPVAAKDLALVGSHLAAADFGGVHLFAIESDGTLVSVARESAVFRMGFTGGGDFRDVSPRIWHGVAAWGDNRIVTADWDSVDVYELVDPGTDDQPDINVSSQRVRCPPQGGIESVSISNNGSGTLVITDIVSSESSFLLSPESAVLAPGESTDLLIEYTGGAPGSALVSIQSNDPDEAPLPIQVFGATSYLDPDEPAVPFSLESWTYDHEDQAFVHGSFDLQTHLGKLVFFHVFGTW